MRYCSPVENNNVLGFAKMPRNAAEIGSRIRALRQAKGMTLGALSTAADVSKGYISQLENGEDVNPTLDRLHQLAKALGVTLADVLSTPKTRALDIPTEIPAGLRELVDDRVADGAPLDSDTVFWLARAQFRGNRPTSKTDFEILLRSLQSSVSGDDGSSRRKKR